MRLPPVIPHFPNPPPTEYLPPIVTLVLLLPRNVYSSDIVLRIPIWKINTWSTRPLKYLRYLGYAILGHIAPLSDERNVVLDDVDLDIPGPLPEVACTYNYCAIPHEIRVTDYEVDNAALTGVTTESRIDFRGTLRERDGETCRAIGLGTSDGYDTAHIIPHAKGSDYITAISEHYVEDARHHIYEINDVRNRLNLSINLHNTQDLIGFLPSPNPILHTDEVLPPSSRPVIGRRVTFHWLENTQIAPQVLALYLVNGQNFDWVPPVNGDLEDVPDWLLHFVYGSRIMDHYATGTSKDMIGNATKDIFYPNGKGRQQVEKNRLKELQDIKAARRSQTETDRRERYRARQPKLGYLDLLDGLLGLRMVASYPVKENRRQANLTRVDNRRQDVLLRDDSGQTDNE